MGTRLALLNFCHKFFQFQLRGKLKQEENARRLGRESEQGKLHHHLYAAIHGLVKCGRKEEEDSNTSLA